MANAERELKKKNTENNKVTQLMSSDGHIFPVEEAVIAEFRAIYRFLPASGGAAIPISKISGEILAKIIDYCRKHKDHKRNNGSVDEEISAWDGAFVDVDEKTLVDLLIGSRFLGVKDLFNLLMVKVAEMMKKKGPSQLGNIEQLRNLFMSNFTL